MANDVVFKTKAFGGFNKDEVMDFVNKILTEKSELENRLAEANTKYTQVYTELNECRSAKAELEKANEEIDSLKSLLEEKEAIISSNASTIDELKKSLEENTMSEDAAAQIDSLQSEVIRLKAECSKARDIERQVGAAMLDARVHSEELVEAAKEKANTVTKSVYAAIGDTALKIDDLSTGIGEIARSFTRSVEEVELRIKALTGDMSKTAQLLITESGLITEKVEKSEDKIEYDFLTDPGAEI